MVLSEFVEQSSSPLTNQKQTMQSSVIPPFENRADADAAFSIVVQLGEISDQLILLELASRQFSDKPDGLLGLLALTFQVRDRWHEYHVTLDQREDPEFAGLSDRILELVRMDKTLSAENREKIAALIREYYQHEE